MATFSHPPAAAMPFASLKKNARTAHAQSKKVKSRKSVRPPIVIGVDKWATIVFGGFSFYANSCCCRSNKRLHEPCNTTSLVGLLAVKCDRVRKPDGRALSLRPGWCDGRDRA